MTELEIVRGYHYWCAISLRRIAVLTHLEYNSLTSFRHFFLFLQVCFGQVIYDVEWFALKVFFAHFS